MKKSLSFAAITIIVLCGFSVSKLKVEKKKLAEIPPIIIGIPPMHLSAIHSKQEKITTYSIILELHQENLMYDYSCPEKNSN